MKRKSPRMRKAETWYVVYTKANQEAKARRRLHDLGYRTFYAFDRVRRRRKRPGMNQHKVEWIERPYFSRYIFVAVQQDKGSLVEIEECDEVSAVVRRRISGEPYEIPKRELDRIVDEAMVRFDVGGYLALMRELVLDPEKVVTLYVDERRRRRIKRDMLPVADIA